VGYHRGVYVRTPLFIHSNLIKISSLVDGFSIRYNGNSEEAYFLLGHIPNLGVS